MVRGRCTRTRTRTFVRVRPSQPRTRTKVRVRVRVQRPRTMLNFLYVVHVYDVQMYELAVFRAGLRKLGPKNNIPEVFLTRKAKNMNHGSPLFPTIQYNIRPVSTIIMSSSGRKIDAKKGDWSLSIEFDRIHIHEYSYSYIVILSKFACIYEDI